METLTPEERSRVILASEFARLLGTNKTTLRYYASLGLIRPYEDANHYHYYSPHQIYQFLCIAAFREMGYALGEIRLTEQIPPDFLPFSLCRVRENLAELQRQQAALEKRILANQNLQRFLELAGRMKPNLPELQPLEAPLCVFCTAAGGAMPAASAAEFAPFLRHVAACREMPEVFPFPFGRRFGDPLRIPESFDAYFSCSQGVQPGGAAMPPGRYLVLLLTGSQEENIRTCQAEIPAFLSGRRLRTVTPFYAMTLSTSGDFLGIRQHISLGFVGVAPLSGAVPPSRPDSGAA